MILVAGGTGILGRDLVPAARRAGSGGADRRPPSCDGGDRCWHRHRGDTDRRHPRHGDVRGSARGRRHRGLGDHRLRRSRRPGHEGRRPGRQCPTHRGRRTVRRQARDPPLGPPGSPRSPDRVVPGQVGRRGSPCGDPAWTGPSSARRPISNGGWTSSARRSPGPGRRGSSAAAGTRSTSCRLRTSPRSSSSPRSILACAALPSSSRARRTSPSISSQTRSSRCWVDQAADSISSPMMLRVASLVTKVVSPVLSSQIATALVMDARDMTVDGPGIAHATPRSR